MTIKPSESIISLTKGGFYMNDNTQVSNKKYRLNPKIKRRVVKVIKSAALVALLSALSVHGIYEIRENRRANNIINSYKSQGNYACLPSTIVSSENYDVNGWNKSNWNFKNIFWLRIWKNDLSSW